MAYGPRKNLLDVGCNLDPVIVRVWFRVGLGLTLMLHVISISTLLRSGEHQVIRHNTEYVLPGILFYNN